MKRLHEGWDWTSAQDHPIVCKTSAIGKNTAEMDKHDEESFKLGAVRPAHSFCIASKELGYEIFFVVGGRFACPGGSHVHPDYVRTDDNGAGGIVAEN